MTDQPASGPQARRVRFKQHTAGQLPKPDGTALNGQGNPVKQLDYHDEGLPGFGLRVGMGGRRTWFVMYRHQGRKRRFTIGPYQHREGGDVIVSLAAARKKAQEILRTAYAGQDPQGEKLQSRRALTFGQLAADYIERYAKPRKRSWADDQRRVNNYLLPAFEHVKADQITRADVRAHMDKIAAGGAPVGANKALETMRGIYFWAIDQELVTFNPAAGIKKQERGQGKTTGERHRFLKNDEFNRYWQAVTAAEDRAPKAAGVLMLMALTGQRRGEVSRMKWEDLDLSGGWWDAPPERTKTGRPYRVPITPRMRQIIEARRGESDEWVFAGKSKEGNIGSNVVTALNREICESQKIADFVPHDLRHTVATHLAGLGVKEEVIARVLHHAAAHSQTAKYNEHRYDTEKRQTLESWERRLLEIVGETKPASNVTALGAA